MGNACTDQHVGLDIQECKLGAVEEGLLLAVDPVVLADVLFEPPDRQRLLLLGQPARRAREVRQDPEAEEGDEDGGGALDDEQPLPCRDAQGPVHVASDTGRDEARKGARNEGSRVEEGGPEACDAAASAQNIPRFTGSNRGVTHQAPFVCTNN